MITTTTQDAAREQYFSGQKTQSQIAADLNIHVKTLSYWIKQNKWREARSAARQMPLFLKNNIYSQLAHLQMAILTREPDRRFPDRHEAEVQRKLLAGIKNLPSLALPETIELMKEFTTGLVRDNCSIVKEVTMLCDNFIQKKIQPIHLYNDPSWIEDQPLPGEEDDVNPQAEKIDATTPGLHIKQVPQLQTALTKETTNAIPITNSRPETSGQIPPQNVDNSTDNIFSEKDKNQEENIENQSSATQPKQQEGIKKDKTIHNSAEEKKAQASPNKTRLFQKKGFSRKNTNRSMDNIRYKH